MKTVKLETAKLLKAAGFSQESYFYWHTNKHGHPPFMRTTKENEAVVTNLEVYAAPTADEVLDPLPRDIEKGETDYFLSIGHAIDTDWQVDY